MSTDNTILNALSLVFNDMHCSTIGHYQYQVMGCVTFAELAGPIKVDFKQSLTKRMVTNVCASLSHVIQKSIINPIIKKETIQWKMLRIIAIV